MNRLFKFREAIFQCIAIFLFLSVAQSAYSAPQNPVVVGQARFSVLTSNCIRIEYTGGGNFVDEPSLFAANRTARFDGFKLKKNDRSTVIDTGAIRLTYSPDGQPLSAANLSATISGGAPWTPGSVNRGNLGGTTRTLDGANGPMDVGQGILSRDGWYLLDDSTTPLLTGDWVSARPKTAGQDWYLFGYGTNYRTALQSLTTVGGVVPLPRKNLFGIWFSRYWPFSATDYHNIIEEYKQHDFPLDNVVLDMDWHQEGWTGWSWNRKLLPEPRKVLADLHTSGVQTTLNLHPADGVAPHEDQYGAFMKALGQNADGKTVPFDAANKQYMKALSGEVLAPLKADGTDFWWLDWQQYPNTRSIPELTNLWWLNEILFRDTAQNGRRGVSFSRWAGWGDHRHPIHFSGDADSGWKMLAFQVPYTATAGNVGCFFWSHDIGGHNGSRNEESYARWCQFGALSAALRSHSARDAATDRRPWNYPQWAEDSMRVSFHLRSELMPYVYSSVAQSCRDSIPLTRPIYFDNPRDEAAYHNGQEYFFGDNLLVAPIVSPGVRPKRVAHQAVYFPSGTWFNTFSGEKYAGQTEVLCAADINEFPLFARSGVPIPMQPYQSRPTSAPLATLRVRVFPGSDGQTGRSQLYEDDSDSSAYKSGAFALTELTYARKGDAVEVTVGATKGHFVGQSPNRALRIELPVTKRALSATLNGKRVAVDYDEASATNAIEVPARSIGSASTIKIQVADIDSTLLQQKAQARRMTGVLGRDFAPQVSRDLLLSALTDDLSIEARDEVLAVIGVGVVHKNEAPTFYNGDLRDVFYQPAGVLDAPAQVRNVSQSHVQLQVGGRNLMLTDTLTTPNNIVSKAKVTVSGVEKGYGLVGSTDGTLSGYPDDRSAEWSSGQKEGATIRLEWDTPQRINRISLYDRINLTDNITRGLLTFSDGTTLEVGTLPDDGVTAYDARFPAKMVSWVEFKVTEVRGSTENSGLSEIAVFRAP